MIYQSETGIGRNAIWRTLRADSLSDVLTYIETTPAAWSCRLESTAPGRSFTGSDSLPAAITLARFGWPEGRANLKSNLKAANMLKPAAPMPTRDYDIAGAYPDVGLYCAGEPACMVSDLPQENTRKPIIRFLVSIAASAMTDASAITNRGAAILSYAQKLEAEGASVEITAIMTVKEGNDAFSFGFPIKASDEYLDVDKAAFALLHPSMLRRIGFALYERNAALQAKFSSCYGSPSNDEPAAWKQDNSVTFPAMLSGSGYRTLSDALATVEGIIQKALK